MHNDNPTLLFTMKFKENLVLTFVVFCTLLCFCAGHIHQTLRDAVGSGNYSYYWLPHPGIVTLNLLSLEGDADLYVSSKNLKPTYDIENHELQSTTCGLEHIKVPAGYDRPLSIAVYGHPSHEMSIYELKIDVFDSTMESDSYPDINAKEVKKTHINKPAPTPNLPGKEESEYEERSVFWTLFLHVLQVLLDLLVD